MESAKVASQTLNSAAGDSSGAYDIIVTPILRKLVHSSRDFQLAQYFLGVALFNLDDRRDESLISKDTASTHMDSAIRINAHCQTVTEKVAEFSLLVSPL